jgi:pimeloyl-ACP methyl ester carboxylesterase
VIHVKSSHRQVFTGFLLLCLAGCATSSPYTPDPRPLETGKLPRPDFAVTISGLGPCTDQSDPTLHLNSHEPVTVLVHGCKGSAGKFRTMAQLYAFHGQQAVCFSYNDHDSLVDASGQLIHALDTLESRMQNHDVTVIGHSMGGLVARKALISGRPDSLRRDDIDLKLVTVSAPFGGIRSAEPCGWPGVGWWSLGTIIAACRLITGDNWYQITSASNFIRQPGPLLPAVQKYLKVVTDERDTCRRADAHGRCIESDFVFTLDEQYQPRVDTGARMINVEVGAGHVEIVGENHVPPRKLLRVLQDNGLLAPTPPERQAALEHLLRKLY